MLQPTRIKNVPAFAATVLTSLLLIFGACQKKEIQGPKGDPGAPGGGGNASISTEDFFTVATGEWKPAADSGSWRAVKSSGLITKDVVAKGSVKLYIQIASVWWELPHVSGDYYTQAGFSEGQVTLSYGSIEGGLPDRPLTANYRMVIIAGAARPAAVNPNPDVKHEVTIAKSHESN